VSERDHIDAAERVASCDPAVRSEVHQDIDVIADVREVRVIGELDGARSAVVLRSFAPRPPNQSSSSISLS
jgi:hypothetical protein